MKRWMEVKLIKRPGGKIYDSLPLKFSSHSAGRRDASSVRFKLSNANLWKKALKTVIYNEMRKAMPSPESPERIRKTRRRRKAWTAHNYSNIFSSSSDLIPSSTQTKDKDLLKTYFLLLLSPPKRNEIKRRQGEKFYLGRRSRAWIHRRAVSTGCFVSVP